MGEHPILKWGAILGTLFTFIGMIVGTWQYLEQVRRDMAALKSTVLQTAETERIRDEGWLDEDSEEHAGLNAIIQGVVEGQEKINTELARQTVWLNDLSAAFNRSFTQREQRFEELENEHKLLLQAIAESQYRLGVHQGTHNSLERLIGDVEQAVEQAKETK